MKRVSIWLQRKAGLTVICLAMGSVLLAPTSYAATDEWTFGIGTGISSLALDGDVGFATQGGGVIAELDLDNGDTADMFESAFGFVSFANKGRWTIHLSYGTLTLEDSDADLDAEWDKASAEFAVEYAFAQTGNHTWGVIAGLAYTDHEWEFQDKITGEKSEPEEDWTDGFVGLTHRVPIADNWAWTNRVDYGFGDSEGTFNAKTGVNWKPLDHWTFSMSLRYEDIEYGEDDDINDSDFYYYDVEETTILLGFVYTW